MKCIVEIYFEVPLLFSIQSEQIQVRWLPYGWFCAWECVLTFSLYC